MSDLIITHRWTVILVWIAIVAAAASGLRLLQLNNNHRLFFSADNPELLAFNALEDTFARHDTLNLVLAFPDAQVFTARNLAIVAELTARAWQIPYASRVDSLTNFQHIEAHGDELIVRDLVPRAQGLSDAALRALKETALAEPLLHGALVRADAQVTAVNVVVQLPRRDEAHEVPEVAAAAHALADDFEARHPGLRVYLTGAVMMNHAFAEAALHDAKTLVPLAFAVIFVLVGVLLAGLRGAFACIVVVALATVIAMGIGGYAGYPVSFATSIAPLVILTVAIANCVHVLDAYQHELHRGLARDDALRQAIRLNLKPVFFASLTTVIGFLTFNFSDVPPFRHLGNLVACGDFASYLLALTLFPAVLAVLPERMLFVSPVRTRWLDMLAAFVIRRRRVLVLGIGVLIVALTACIPRNRLNDVFVHYFDETTAFRQATDFTVEHLTGVYHLYFTLETGETEGINDPAFLAQTAAFVAWLRAQPEVRHVASFTDTLKRLNRAMHGDAPEAYRLPEARDLAAQYLLLYEMSLPYGLDLNNQINVDRSALKVSVGIDTLSSRDVIDFTGRAEQWLGDNAPRVKTGTGSGSALMFSHLGLRNIHSMLGGTVVALVLVSGVLLLLLRSVRLGLLSLVPNLVPLALGFGLWGLCVGEVGLSLSIVASMALGIIVDDTVHFLVKYQRGRRERGLSAEDAVRHAFRANGRAMLVTTGVLVAGFLVLALSRFELNAGMGLLTAAVLAFALLADWLFLSPLLLYLERHHA
ncbi:MAG: RND family transporter [Gammaproteobacteria bacterium]